MEPSSPGLYNGPMPIFPRRGLRLVRSLCFALAALLTISLAANSAAQAAEPKLPRFTSLRAGEVNMRSGPGVRYPIEWIYTRRFLPMLIVSQFDSWRKVRDWKGVEGWVHKSMLSGRRSIIVTGIEHMLYREDSADSKIIARVEPRVVGRLIKCPDKWCQIEIAGMRGWMRRSWFWGIGVEEILK